MAEFETWKRDIDLQDSDWENKIDPFIWVELHFTGLTEEEKELFKDFVCEDGQIRVRKVASIASVNPDSISIIWEAYTKEYDQQWSQAYKDGYQKVPWLSERQINALPEFYFIPASRQLSDNEEIESSTLFGRLLQQAILDTERNAFLLSVFAKKIPEIKEVLFELDIEPLVDNINSELKPWNVEVLMDLVFPPHDVLTDFSVNLALNDGLTTSAAQKGSGLQHILQFALLKAWCKVLKQSFNTYSARKSMIFAIEEPELFLHPHMQRELFDSLKDIASFPNYQVLICSHSPHFIDLDFYRNIGIVTKNSHEKGTTIRQCTYDLFESDKATDSKNKFHMAHWVNPDRGELFFARKVILVEGETEKVVFPFLAKKLNCFDPTISIIDCGSKGNLILYIKILNAFKYKYSVVFDRDSVNTGEKKYNKKIKTEISKQLGDYHMMVPNFDKQAHIPQNMIGVKGKALAALEFLEKQFSKNKIAPEILDVVRNAFK